jgi:Flp pilus assembly pilin Flp
MVRVGRFATRFVANIICSSEEPMNYLKSFVSDEQGAELAEYAVGTAILVAIAIIVYKILGDAINVKMSTVANEVQK